MIIDAAVYEDGVRSTTRRQLSEMLAAGAADDAAFVWIGLHEPTHDEFEHVAREFKLHPLAIEDAVHAHQRPKVERYGDSWFVVLKTAQYIDSEEVVRLGELMVFVGAGFVVTVRHGDGRELASIRAELESQPEVMRKGPFVVLHAILDRVIDDYAMVISDVDIDIDQIQAQVFSGDRKNHAERIFRLKRELLEFRQSVQPLAEGLEQLTTRTPNNAVPGDLHDYYRDVIDHARRVTERIITYDLLLYDALHANVAQVGMRQNEDMRKISAWVAIVSVPTMIAGVYGMNFEHMPELESPIAYPLVIGFMASCCFALYRNFKHRHWL